MSDKASWTGKTWDRDCVACGRPYTAIRPNQRSCSDECRVARKAEMDRQRHARQQSAFTGMTCGVCGRPLRDHSIDEWHAAPWVRRTA